MRKDREFLFLLDRSSKCARFIEERRVVVAGFDYAWRLVRGSPAKTHAWIPICMADELSDAAISPFEWVGCSVTGRRIWRGLRGLECACSDSKPRLFPYDFARTTGVLSYCGLAPTPFGYTHIRGVDFERHLPSSISTLTLAYR